MDTRHLSNKELETLSRFAAAQDWDAYFAFSKTCEDTAENRLKKTLFLVEATSFEYHFLWLINADHNSPRPYPNLPKLQWEEMSGWLITVGHRNKKPVCISVRWAKINHRLVMFWEATSKIVDHGLIEDWFKKHFNGTYDKGTRRAETDANNFHNVVHLIEDSKFWME